MERIHPQGEINKRKERRHKIAVVGSGIAGSSAALELAKEGFDVTVIERRGEPFSATSAGAIQAHLGGLYSGNMQTAKECLDSAITFKKMMPLSLNERKALFLVADNSEVSLDDYLDFYSELREYYASLSCY